MYFYPGLYFASPRVYKKWHFHNTAYNEVMFVSRTYPRTRKYSASIITFRPRKVVSAKSVTFFAFLFCNKPITCMYILTPIRSVQSGFFFLFSKNRTRYS